MICNSFYRSDPGFSRLYIFGAGGSGREIAWLAEQSWGSLVELVYLVDASEYLSAPVNGSPVSLLAEIVPEPNDRFVVAIGDTTVRRRAVAACIGAGLRPATLVHPRTEMGRTIEIGQGSVVCGGSTVTTNVSIGEHTHVNVGCTVSHDVRLGDFVSLSPGVHVAGHVHIGNDVFIGTGATIINGQPGAPLVVGDKSIIAAGACVIRDVERDTLVAGVPAVRKR